MCKKLVAKLDKMVCKWEGFFSKFPPTRFDLAPAHSVAHTAYVYLDVK